MRKFLPKLTLLFLCCQTSVTALADDLFCKIPKGFESFVWVSPAEISVDLDGDDQADSAMLVRQLNTGKRGIAICSTKEKRIFIIGAGTDFGNGGDDFTWMNIWEIHPNDPMLARIEPRNNAAKQNRLFVGIDGGPGGQIFFEGGEFKWEQFGE